MANGGFPTPYEYDEKEIEDRALEKTGTFFSELGNRAGDVLSDVAYGAGDSQALGRYSRGENPDEFLYGRDRFDSALKRAGLPPDATPEMVTAYRSGTPVSAFKPAVDTIKTAYSPSAIQEELGQGNPVFVGNIDYGGNQFNIKDASIAGPATSKDIDDASKRVGTDDGITTSSMTTSDRLLQSASSNMSAGMNPVVASSSIDTGYSNMNPDYQPDPSIKKLPTTGVAKAAKQDASYAAASDYENLIQKSINKMTDEKGKMQNKWLRIAAGAFNAAQKGSPTLLGGLADLGSGVTEQLLALDKDEQKQAQELFALYSAREKIRYDRYTTKRDYDKDRKTRLSDSIKNYNADLGRYLNVDVISDLEKKEAKAILATQYADQGVKTAQSDYARYIKEINGIVAGINADIKAGTIEQNGFASALDQALKADPALALMYDVAKDRQTQGVEDWLEEGLII